MMQRPGVIRLSVLVLITAAVLFTACSPGSEPTTSFAPVVSVSLNTTGASMRPGNTFALTATIQPSEASQSISWSSDDSGIATVSSSGVVTAVGTGIATITASAADGKTATCDINVWGDDADGFLKMRTDKESQKGRGWWINVPQPTSPVLANHPIVLYLRKVSGYSGAGFGCLFCYVDRNNYYGLFVTANGGYRITKNVEGTVSAIVDWTGSAYLNTEPGETNKIAISQPSPGVLSFQFNDQPAITCSDSAFTAGGLCFYGAVSTNEDFPSVPLDIRFKLVSPEEYPTAVRYAAYSTTRAALDAISLNDASQERMDVGLYPALYSGTVLTKLGESISGATSSFLASISADTLLIVVPKGVDNFVRIDAIEILTPAGSTLGYFGRGYDGTVLIPLDMSSANVRNRENASGLPDDIYAEFGISADSGRIDCAYGFIYFNSMIATIPPEITSGLTSVQVKIHCAE